MEYYKWERRGRCFLLTLFSVLCLILVIIFFKSHKLTEKTVNVQVTRSTEASEHHTNLPRYLSTDTSKYSFSSPIMNHLIKLNNTKWCKVKQIFLEEANFYFIKLPWQDDLIKIDSEKNVHVVIIHSAVSNFEKRDIIRESWGTVNGKMIKGITFVVRFILGVTADTSHATTLTKEHKQYGDLVQGHFKDTYKNLTIKHLSGLKYVKKYWQDANWIIKADDDTYLDIGHLINATHMAVKKDARVFCPRLGMKERSLRFGKWKLQKQVYPFPFLPPFCHGQLIVYKYEVVTNILLAASSTPCHIWLDDVHVTGILVDYIGEKYKEMSLPKDLSTLIHDDNKAKRKQKMKEMWIKTIHREGF